MEILSSTLSADSVNSATSVSSQDISKIHSDTETLHLDLKNKYNSLYIDKKVIVEGPDPTSDHSFFLNHLCEDLANFEKGIPIESFIEKAA